MQENIKLYNKKKSINQFFELQMKIEKRRKGKFEGKIFHP